MKIFIIIQLLLIYIIIPVKTDDSHSIDQFRCEKGQFFDQQINICNKCSENCEQCNFFKDLCTSCSENQKINFQNSCVCKDSFYDISNRNQVQKNCQKCPNYCDICQDITGQCLECRDQYNMVLNQNTKKCECKKHFSNFDNIEGICLPCHYHNNQCLQQCPLNTQLNSSMICMPINTGNRIISQQNFLWFLIIAGILIIGLLIYIIYAYITKDNSNKHITLNEIEENQRKYIQKQRRKQKQRLQQNIDKQNNNGLQMTKRELQILEENEIKQEIYEQSKRELRTDPGIESSTKLNIDRSPKKQKKKSQSEYQNEENIQDEQAINIQTYSDEIVKQAIINKKEYNFEEPLNPGDIITKSNRADCTYMFTQNLTTSQNIQPFIQQ